MFNTIFRLFSGVLVVTLLATSVATPAVFAVPNGHPHDDNDGQVEACDHPAGDNTLDEDNPAGDHPNSDNPSEHRPQCDEDGADSDEETQDGNEDGSEEGEGDDTSGVDFDANDDDVVVEDIDFDDGSEEEDIDFDDVVLVDEDGNEVDPTQGEDEEGQDNDGEENDDEENDDPIEVEIVIEDDGGEGDVVELDDLDVICGLDGGEGDVIFVGDAISDVSTDVVEICIGETKVTGFVWDDLDQDGLQDENELGLAGVTVELYAASPAEATTVTDPVLVESVLTDENGEYEFVDLALGTYFVSVSLVVTVEEEEVTNLPLDCKTYTLKNAGEDSLLDSDLENEIAEDLGKSVTFSLSEEGQEVVVDGGFICEEEGSTGGSSGSGSGTKVDAKRSGGSGSGNIPRSSTPSSPTFTAQSVDTVDSVISLDPCLQVLVDRDLQFVDGTNDFAELLKKSALMGPGYQGKTQFVISGYNNSTFETGEAELGLGNSLTRLEAAKIITTSLLCYEIAAADSLADSDWFADLPVLNPDNQWFSDLAYTAAHIGLVNGQNESLAALTKGITKQEFVTMLVRAYEAKYGTVILTETEALDYIDSESWAYNNFLKAEQLGLMTEALRNLDGVLKRSEAFEAIVNGAYVLGAYQEGSMVLVGELIGQ